MGRFRWSAVVVVLLGALLMVAPHARADGNVADLFATVGADKEVGVGDQVGMSIAYTNSGPDVATAAYFTAKLSGPGQYNPALSSPECKFDGPSASCKLGDVPVGPELLLQLWVDTTGPGTIVQNWALTAPQDDPIPAGNSGTVSTAVIVPTQDLAATISTFATAFAGETLSSTAAATNLGVTGFVAFDVVLTDTFSGPATFDAAASDPRCSASGQTVTCNAGTLFPNQGVSAFPCTNTSLDCALFNIALTFTGPGTVSQTVDVSSALPDPNPGNNTASGTTAVQPDADLYLSLVKSPAATSYMNQDLDWQLNVFNEGADAPTAVVVTGTLSGSATWDASQSSPGCSVSGATITCSLGSVAVGANAALDVAASPSVGTVSASFTVTSELPDPIIGIDGIFDPVPDDSLTPPTVTVVQSTDLQGEFSGVTLTPGTVAVQFIVTNLGPSDDLQAGATFGWSPSGSGGASLASFGPAGVSCTGGKAFVTPPLICGGGALPNGGSVTIDVTLTAPSGTTVTITGSATGSLPDPNQSNNSASVTVVVP